MIYCLYKFKKVPGRRGEYEPENKKTEFTLTVLTTIGVIALLAPGLLVWDEYVSPPDDVMPVEVMAQQWFWSFRLPGEDGILGTSDARNINSENPFGLNPNDPNGQDDVLIEGDDLHLVIDQPIKVLLRSIDVLHNFYVPQFRGKMDMVPGMITYYWFTPEKIGEYEILCAELCGVGHHAMRGYVSVDSEESYDEWLSEQMTFKDLMESADLEANKFAKNN
tara:strand:- start:840 stop:1502 length:663 start_codon:yes stop_codon:yes gene_type:complete